MSERVRTEEPLKMNLEDAWTPSQDPQWRLPEERLQSVQKVMLLAGLQFVELRQIEQVLIADDAFATVMKQESPDLLSPAEHASLLTYAEETWADLQANDLGGFSNDNRPFWLVHAFKHVIERYGRRDVGLHHTQDELRSMGVVIKSP